MEEIYYDHFPRLNKNNELIIETASEKLQSYYWILSVLLAGKEIKITNKV